METPYEKLEVFLDTQYGKRKRLRLGWKQKERDFIMRGITKHNKRLDGMLKRTAETRTDVTPTQHWATTSCIPHIGLRQKMSDLRDAIAKAWCTCVENHELRFGLSKMWKDSDNVKMDMIMNMSQDGENWHWAESKIQIRLKESAFYTSNINLSFTNQWNSSPPPTIVESPSDHRRRSSSSFSGTTLAGSPIRETAYEYTNTTTSRKTSINEVIVIKQMTDSAKASRRYSGSRHDGTFVEDICRIVQKGQKARRASQLQFYQDKLWHYTTTTASEVHYSEPGIRLDQFLQKGKMTMKDRKILQVLLAQSVLFFPWVGQDLNKTSIVFHHDLNKPFATLMIDREDPATHQVQSSLTTDSNDSQYKPYNNETLAALATTLFEIEFERTIERFRIPDDVTDGDSSNFDTDFWTLTRVLKDEKDNMYLGIYEAIHSCISCDFEPDLPPQLDNPGFLQHVYERIVAPLEQELLRAFSITMPFFDDPGSPIKTSTKIVNFQ